MYLNEDLVVLRWYRVKVRVKVIILLSILVRGCGCFGLVICSWSEIICWECFGWFLFVLRFGVVCGVCNGVVIRGFRRSRRRGGGFFFFGFEFFWIVVEE